MGKKIPYDEALRIGRTEPNDSVYAKENPYGYKLNVNHPVIRSLYDRYKAKVGESILSDAQRKEFEGYILQKLEKKAVVQSTAQKGEQNEHIS